MAFGTDPSQKRPIIVKIHPREDALKIPDLIRTKTNLVPKEITEICTVDIAGLDLQAMKEPMFKID